MDGSQQLRVLCHSLENAVRSVLAAQNELSLISKLPPETLVAVSEFVADPRTRESMFEIVKLTHICQYWRSTLVSCPHLWSTIFVKNDHRDFVAACLERSRELPLTVYLDLKYGDSSQFPDCTCLWNNWSHGMQINEANPCRYHTTIDPLVNTDPTPRVRKLDVHLAMLDDYVEESADQYLEDVFDHFKLFAFPLHILESFSFRLRHRLDIDDHMELPRELFCWEILPPTKLRHLALHGCCGGPIQAVRNLTSFELSGDPTTFDRLELDQRTFFPLISNSPSLASISLSYCRFPVPAQSSRIAPVRLSELKTLRLMNTGGLAGFSSLIEVPAVKALSSLWISGRKRKSRHEDTAHLLIRAESDDGFQLSYETFHNDEVASDWLGVTCNADPGPTFVRFEGEVDPTGEHLTEVSSLPLFINAKILEIGTSFASPWYCDFWKDLAKAGQQLTTLRLEVTEGTNPEVAKSVEKFAKERFEKGMPLSKFERMMFELVNGEGEEKAKRLWEEFRAGLDIDQYLTAQ